MQDSEYWWYVRCVVANKPYIVCKDTERVVAADHTSAIDAEFAAAITDFETRLRSTWRTDKRITCMLRAQAYGLLNYAEVCEHPEHSWRELPDPALREEMAFEEVARRSHVDNSIGQLTGLLAMMVTPSDREQIADIQDDIRTMTCPWYTKVRTGSAEATELAAKYLQQLAAKQQDIEDERA